MWKARSKRRSEIWQHLESLWHGVEGRDQSRCPGILGELLHAHDFNRHPDVANLFLHELEGAREGAFGAAVEARRAVIGVLGFDPPTWEDAT